MTNKKRPEVVMPSKADLAINRFKKDIIDHVLTEEQKLISEYKRWDKISDNTNSLSLFDKAMSEKKDLKEQLISMGVSKALFMG